jgi:hypothetical protein
MSVRKPGTDRTGSIQKRQQAALAPERLLSTDLAVARLLAAMAAKGHQPVGVVLDRLGEAGCVPSLPKGRERSVIDMDGDRHSRLGVDADRAHDRAEIDDTVNPYA